MQMMFRHGKKQKFYFMNDLHDKAQDLQILQLYYTYVYIKLSAAITTAFVRPWPDCRVKRIFPLTWLLVL